jgi:hypothetical protein
MTFGARSVCGSDVRVVVAMTFGAEVAVVCFQKMSLKSH